MSHTPPALAAHFSKSSADVFEGTERLGAQRNCRVAATEQGTLRFLCTTV